MIGGRRGFLRQVRSFTMSNITQVRAVVKESLLGQEQMGDLNLSAQSKTTFEKNCRRDEKSGEVVMTEEDFVNAIAPVGEDYVSFSLGLTSGEQYYKGID